MWSFYISSFIKISSLIRKINIPQFLRFLIPPVLPPPLRLVESGKRLLWSQFVQVPDMPTNFHRPNTFRSTKLSKALEIPPNYPKRMDPFRLLMDPIRSVSILVMPITYLGRVLILSTNLHPDLSTLSVFQYFRFPPPTPSSVTGFSWDLK